MHQTYPVILGLFVIATTALLPIMQSSQHHYQTYYIKNKHKYGLILVHTIGDSIYCTKNSTNYCTYFVVTLIYYPFVLKTDAFNHAIGTVFVVAYILRGSLAITTCILQQKNECHRAKIPSARIWYAGHHLGMHQIALLPNQQRGFGIHRLQNLSSTCKRNLSVRVGTLVASSCVGCCRSPVLCTPCTHNPWQHMGAAQVHIIHL